MHRIDAADHVGNQFSDGDQATGVPGTLVDSAWLNAVQEELAGFIEAAGVTLVKGTNTQLATALAAWLQAVAHTFTAKQAFNGAAGDANAAVELGGTITTRKLKAELPGGAGGMTTRIYSLPDGTLEIVVGAAWVPAGPYWESDGYDLSTACSKLVLGRSSLELYRYSDDMFADSAWILHARFGLDGKIKFAGVTTGADGSNPPADTPITNELRAANLCKAWASISHTRFNSGPPEVAEALVLDDAINVSGVAIADSDLAVRVTFAAPMADANYSVCLTSRPGPVSDDLASALPRIKAKTVNYVDLGFGSWSNLLTNGWGLDVHVFGKQTS